MYIVTRTYKDKELKKTMNVGDVYEGSRVDLLLSRGAIEKKPNKTSSLTVAEIKEQLDAKGIEYDSKARKDDLIQLLEG